MIIDIHTHLAYYKVYSPSYLSGMLAGSPEISPSGLEVLYKAFLRDKDGSRHIAEMDRAGIDKSVLLIIDSELRLGTLLSIEEIYQQHHMVMKQYPGRFIVFSGVDPRRDNAYDLFVKSIEFYGFRGLKLYPPMGYRMDHPVLCRIYEYCQAYKLPVLIHTGDSLQILDNIFSKVANAVAVVKAYPGVPFILAHAGYQLHEPGMKELAGYPNVYFDIAGIQSLLKEEDSNPFQLLSPEDMEKFAAKIVFGSDAPLFSFMNPLERQIQDISEFLLKSGLSESQVANIFSNPSLSEILLQLS
ncbi:amidohydrolase family protein [Chitinophaga sp. GbtcB8]|uniref:amidohydrolase family protein n=1 Tax=Chitinophaga sp. GbtcB8 TaxID=2824753 RepID=UPI0020C620EA|nr:amidohydrolase family protein [Chitinophaga sp. GbtcB8]